MTTTIADAYNNPFLIDGKTGPPARSAFAVLNCERDELETKSVDQILARAVAAFDACPELATVYGRQVTKAELKSAADRLRDPRSLVVNELLDYRLNRFDVSDLVELKEAVADYKERVARYREPEMTDPRLLGELLGASLAAPTLATPIGFKVPPPELPSTAELLGDLA